MDLGSVFQTIILISAPLVVILILLQQRGASLGSGTGGSSSELYTTRRGLEKSMFNTTIVLSFIFVLSILGLLIFV